MRLALMLAVVVLAGCQTSPAPDPDAGKTYPTAGNTYLTHSPQHGYQVNYIAQGRAWLWYPGNQRAVPEKWRQKTIAGDVFICWTHPANTYNPVLQLPGGDEMCVPRAPARRRVVSVLPGDVFDLASGRVPYVLNRDKAPDQF